MIVAKELEPSYPQGLGVMLQDEIAAILGTGYNKFFTSEINGLAKIKGPRVDILSVISVNSGRGHFKEFIENLKTIYKQIYIWEIWNDDLMAALKRYDFVDTETIEDDGEKLTGLVWQLPDVHKSEDQS